VVAVGTPIARVATIFVRCPDPVAFRPDQVHVVSFPGAEISGFEGTALHIYSGNGVALRLASQIDDRLFGSVRFHRGVSPGSRIKKDVDEVRDLITTVLPDAVLGPPVRDDGNPDTDWNSYSVAEITVPIVRPDAENRFVPCDVNNGSMGFAMDVGFDSLFMVLRAHRHAAQRTSNPPTLEPLGHMAIVATRPADPAAGTWDGPATFVGIAMAIPNNKLLPPDFTDDGLMRVRAYLNAELIDHPGYTLGEIQEDARAALQIQGTIVPL
jgi:hypothetical protein